MRKDTSIKGILLNFTDNKKYKDRLRDARKKTGQEDATDATPYSGNNRQHPQNVNGFTGVPCVYT